MQILATGTLCAADPPHPEWITVGPDGRHFVRDGSTQKFVVWGVNYDHDRDGALLEDYWRDDWDTVVEDFQEIKALGCNVVRVHLQLGRFMKTADDPDQTNLNQLAELVRLVERTGLYLDITGLGCYHKQDVPEWYDSLSESDRWDVQCRFWQAVAKVCQDSPAVFCYDLMNEPILPGEEPETEWLAGELAGKFFVQRISLDAKGRSRQQIAQAWVAKLVGSIRAVDERHLITVGVIPWALPFKGAKPLFYDPAVGEPLDFVSVHFYPEQDEVADALRALQVYEVGKPLVIEEMFPLKCDLNEMDAFIDGSREFADGWISFYWGQTVEEYASDTSFTGAVMGKWLQYFREHAPSQADDRP